MNENNSTAAPEALTPEAREQLSIARILSQPLNWPAFDNKHEAMWFGRARVRILRAKLSKSSGGAKMLWIEGMVVSTCKLSLLPSQYPANNPEGWDCTLFSEDRLPVLDEAGQPVLDDKGQPRTYFPQLGHGDATGRRFVYGGTLADGMAAEMCVNNARFLGWLPERVQAPLTGMSFTDFVPADDADYVTAEALGMTGEFIAEFALKQPQEGTNFAARIQLVAFKLAEVKTTKAEAGSIDGEFGWLLATTASGKKYDSRKAAGAGAGKGRAAPAKGATPPPSMCGKPCGTDSLPCKSSAGHDGACTPTPF